MRTISYKDLVEMLKTKPGAMPVGIVATTDAKAKRGNPYGVIRKTVRAVGFVGADYENSVNRAIDRQREGNGKGNGEFVAERLPWGQWLVPNKVIEHKGKLYLRTQTTSGQRRKQAAKVLCYRAENGQFISREDARSWLPEDRESARQAAAGLEGAAAQVWVRTYALENVQRIRINGISYQPVAE